MKRRMYTLYAQKTHFQYGILSRWALFKAWKQTAVPAALCLAHHNDLGTESRDD